MISVIIPTISARTESGWLDRCLNAYEANTDIEWQPIVIHDRPSCGIAWNEGIKLAQGDYIQLSADDLEPLPGWADAAVASAERGELPAARILNPDGSLQSCGTDAQEHDTGEEAAVARIPFGTREQFERIGPMMEEHYMGDYWFSHRGREVGYLTIVQRDYAFVHHFAPEGRKTSFERDLAAYRQRGGQ